MQTIRSDRMSVIAVHTKIHVRTEKMKCTEQAKGTSSESVSE